MEFKNYYQIMGVSPQANQDAIKQAYRRLAQKYHPDVSALPNAEDRFKEIGEAYEVLKDPEKRGSYEAFYRRWRSAGRDSTRSYSRPESSAGASPASESTLWQSSGGTQRMTMNGFGPFLFFVIGAFMFAHFSNAGGYQTPGVTSEPAEPITVEVQDVSGAEKVNSFVRNGELSPLPTIHSN